MPEPHAFAVRNNAARLARINRSQPQDKARDRPAIPRARNAIASTATRTPRIVTTRTSLFDEAGWREDGADLGKMRSDIFFPRNLDDPNRFEMAGEIRLFAQSVEWAKLSVPTSLHDGVRWLARRSAPLPTRELELSSWRPGV